MMMVMDAGHEATMDRTLLRSDIRCVCILGLGSFGFGKVLHYLPTVINLICLSLNACVPVVTRLQLYLNIFCLFDSNS